MTKEYRVKIIINGKPLYGEWTTNKDVAEDIKRMMDNLNNGWVVTVEDRES